MSKTCPKTCPNHDNLRHNLAKLWQNPAINRSKKVHIPQNRYGNALQAALARGTRGRSAAAAGLGAGPERAGRGQLSLWQCPAGCVMGVGGHREVEEVLLEKDAEGNFEKAPFR